MNKKNKINMTLLIAMLLFSMFAVLTTTPQTTAHSPPWYIQSYAYLVAAPNPVGVGQPTYITMWVDNVIGGTPLPDNDIRRLNYTLTITDPNGKVTSQHWDVVQDTTGIQFYAFTPDVVGNYTIKFDYGQQVYQWNNAYLNDVYSAVSATTQLTVQQEPLPAPINSYPLPTEYWTRPIEAQNTDWFTLASNWLGGAYLANRLQPYGTAPNSAHVMWTKPVDYGGVVGGNYSDIQGEGYYMGRSYNARFSNPLVLNGVLYYELPLQDEGTGGGFMAVDLTTGQQLWYNDTMGAPGTSISRPTFGYLMDIESPNQHGVIPQGILFTNNFAIGYDPRTGKTLYNITDVPSGTAVTDSKGAIIRFVWNSNTKLLSQWNSSRMWSYGWSNEGGQTPSTGKINATYNPYTITSTSTYDWNKTITGLGSGTWSIQYAALDNILLFTQGSLGGSLGGRSPVTGMNVTAISLKPESRGNILWTKTYDAPPGNSSRAFAGLDPVAGVFVLYDQYTLDHIGYSLTDGSQLWVSKESSNNAFAYFDSFWPGFVAYGNIYTSGYAGVVTARDIKTGNILWTYGNGGVPGNTTYDVQQPWGLRPLMINVIADGKIYASGDEHSPNTPLYKDNLVRAINATTGQEIWTMKGWICGTGGGGQANNAFVADGYLGYINLYDMRIYVVGKGPSAMTVDAPKSAITLGGSLVISGTVTDIAAGTKQKEQAARFPNGVAAVSDASQGAWMEYVYMQKPRPTDTVGVPVTISVVDANGNYRDIGTVTSDADGFYNLNWKPDIEGKYTVYASFGGSESYWPSHAVSAFAVDSAPPTPSPYPVTTQPPTDMYIVGSTVAIIIAIALVGLLILRKRP